MKKFMVLLIAAAMAFTFAGTAMAQNTVDLSAADPNLNVYWPLVYSDMDNTDQNTGASAYLVTNDPWWRGGWTFGGTTVFAVSNERTNPAGTEMRAVALTDAGVNALGGVTPIGPPQLLTGTTETMILYVLASAVDGAVNTGGATVYRIDGGSGDIDQVGVPYTGVTAVNAAGGGNVLEQTVDGTTPWCVAPPTLEWDAATSAASIYGVSGTSYAGTLRVGTGVSIWQMTSATLAVTGTTTFSADSGVTAVYAAPVISGNSLFVVGHALGGISVFQFDKRDLTAGGDNFLGAALNSETVIEPGGMLNPFVAQITPTPVAQSEGASGGTLYVVDWSGGVTLYDTQNLDPLFAYDYVKSRAGVWASPVASDRRLVIPWSSSVSVFATNPGAENVAGGSGVSPIWEYDFDEAAGSADGRWRIRSTPVISNGYVWVTVLDIAGAWDAWIWRFELNDDYDGNGDIVATEPMLIADPIIVGDYDANDDNENGFLWYSSYEGTVDRTDQSRWAEAEEYWTQYKFDAAKTAENTLADPDDDDDDFIGDSSGCFLSTIK